MELAKCNVLVVTRTLEMDYYLPEEPHLIIFVNNCWPCAMLMGLDGEHDPRLG